MSHGAQARLTGRRRWVSLACLAVVGGVGFPWTASWALAKLPAVRLKLVSSPPITLDRAKWDSDGDYRCRAASRMAASGQLLGLVESEVQAVLGEPTERFIVDRLGLEGVPTRGWKYRLDATYASTDWLSVEFVRHSGVAVDVTVHSSRDSSATPDK